MNPFDNVMPEDLNILSKTAIEVIVDLNKYPSLRNPGLVEAGMKQFTQRYPNLKRWRAFISDDYLRILAEGIMDEHPTFYTVVQVEDV